MKNEEKQIYLTSEGFLKLEEEVDNLKKVERPRVIKAIKEARAQGDLSENAEYSAARDEQGKLESRIKEIEYTLEHATVIDKAADNGKVSIGCEVELKYDDDDEIETYTIVGSQEADPFNNKISNESPIAAAILGKKAGDTVEVCSPDGMYKVNIVRIS